MRRIRLLIQFDGTDYCGWAEQPGLRTVKGTLKSSIRRATGEVVDLRGCSRTDSGAHARGFVADFATKNTMPPKNWADVINRQSSDDIRIVESERIFEEFHSRFFARSRTYEYRIAKTYKAEPTRARYVYEDGRKMNVTKMQAAAKHLVGRNDFRAFGEELGDLQNAVRDAKKVRVAEVGDEVRIRIEATAFIRGMMRRISGGLLEVGLGKRSVKDFATLLDPKRRDDLKWPVVLPAKGLTLLGVKYGSKMRDLRLERMQEEDEEE